MNIRPKVIIAIWHCANQGKTQTLRALAEQLLTEHRYLYPDAVAPSLDAEFSQDFSLEIDFGGVRVHVETQGDPGTDLETRLRNTIEKSRPDLVFCTTRTRGETPGAVDRVAGPEGYQVIWTSTYQAGRNHAQFNWIKAKHLLDLVREMGFLPRETAQQS